MGKKFLRYFRPNCSRVFCQNLGRGPAAHPEQGWASREGDPPQPPPSSLALAECGLDTPCPGPSSQPGIGMLTIQFSLGGLISIADTQPCIQAEQLRTV